MLGRAWLVRFGFSFAGRGFLVVVRLGGTGQVLSFDLELPFLLEELWSTLTSLLSVHQHTFTPLPKHSVPSPCP